MQRVFATVGTTSFDELTETVISIPILEVLANKGCTKLTIQFGRGREISVPSLTHGIAIECYRYKPSIQEDICDADLVISHSGAGSILEALEAQKCLLVVINETLMGNHQLELAHQLAKDGYLQYCNCRTLKHTLQDLDASSFQKYIPGEPEKFVQFLNRVMNYA